MLRAPFEQLYFYHLAMKKMVTLSTSKSDHTNIAGTGISLAELGQTYFSFVH